ncbi:outer membrane beta-barrel protein [Aquimarina agarivorans]|uniref:outer membrane beta-barrel protein n=1 Tax=Aquimarina agarivorans TaxID=980584 RepID=UPI001300C1F2
MRNLYGLGVYAKVYKGITRKLVTSLKLSGNYNTIHINGTSNTNNRFIIQLQPGLSYFISEKLALEASISNLRYAKTYDDINAFETKNDRFSFSIDTSDINLGVAYYF